MNNITMDFNKISVYISVDECIPFTHPTENVKFAKDIVYCILKYNDSFYGTGKIDKNILSTLFDKLTINLNEILEKDSYIKFADSRYKQDKGYDEHNFATIGIPSNAFSVTINELITMYRAVEIWETSLERIKEHLIMILSDKNIYEGLHNIKSMLERRLAYAILNYKEEKGNDKKSS